MNDYIKTKLTELGFTCEQDGERITYKNLKHVRQQGQVMIINGTRQEIPGQVTPIEHEIVVLGEGWVEDSNGDQTPLLFINFKTSVNNEPILDYFEGFYMDKIEDFDKIFNQIYR